MANGSRPRVRLGAAAVAACMAVGLLPLDAAAVPGVTRRRIKIGVHASLTGAVPLPGDSVQKGANLLWEWLKERNRPVNGRHVEVVLKNDNYNPSQAVAVCKQMVEQDNVFLLSGLMSGSNGGDQTLSCARYAASVGVPYVTIGSYKLGVRELRNYFAVTMPMEEQAPLLVDHLVSDLAARRDVNGIVRYDTPMYEQVHDRWVTAMAKREAPVAYDRALSRGAATTEAQLIVREMKTAGVENVTMLVSPIFFLQVLRAAETQEFAPLWNGVGLTMTISDEIASIGCRNGTIGGARFLSPLPAFIDRDSFDRTYDRAVEKVYPESSGGDSVVWLGWATSKALKDMLELPGRRLTRQRFIRRAQSGRTMKTGILPPARFTRRDRFGGRSTHLLEARCRDQRWHTVRRFVSDF
ncbi:MAG: ABC transporter substrate-binding protein [Actinomycetota bacterium]|nr:ABC transporter substrate-binding protein [Actinomycetota bacterium]